MENFIVNVLYIEKMWLCRCEELGLITEADSYEELLRRCRVLGHQLHSLNGHGDGSFQLSFRQLLKPVLLRRVNIIRHRELRDMLAQYASFDQRGPIFHEIWRDGRGGYFTLPNSFQMVQTAEEAIMHAKQRRAPAADN